MSEELKSLVRQYNQAYEASKMLPALRARIIPVIKSQRLERTKFNFGDHAIGFHSYIDNDGLTQKLVKETLDKFYPQINKDDFMKRMLSLRKQRSVETLKIYQSK